MGNEKLTDIDCSALLHLWAKGVDLHQRPAIFNSYCSALGCARWSLFTLLFFVFLFPWCACALSCLLFYPDHSLSICLLSESLQYHSVCEPYLCSCLSCQSHFLLAWSVLMLYLCPLHWIDPIYQPVHRGLNLRFVLMMFVCDLHSCFHGPKSAWLWLCLWIIPCTFCWIGLISRCWPSYDYSLILCPILSWAVWRLGNQP